VDQAASLNALRQRFGRLNRSGRQITAEGMVIALDEDIQKTADDPVYGDRIRLTWDALGKIAQDSRVDFGVEALPTILQNADIDPNDLASERTNAPVLMPVYLDLWSQTSPRPAADPEIGLFLHGTRRTATGVSIVWRSDISVNDLQRESNIDEIIGLLPPRAAEAIEVPLWVARTWLRGARHTSVEDISDAPEREIENSAHGLKSRKVYRWAGPDNPATGVVEDVNKLRPGDMLIVPSEYGGCDEFGWDPLSTNRVVDVANIAAKPYWGTRCAVRIFPSIFQHKEAWNQISNLLCSDDIEDKDLVNCLLMALSSEAKDIDSNPNLLFDSTREALTALLAPKGYSRLSRHFPYGNSYERGAILVADRGIIDSGKVTLSVTTTEDDAAACISNQPVYLEDHGRHVAEFVRDYALTLGLENDISSDLCLAAYLHDLGKADPRFQTRLAGGDPWNRSDEPPLAKGTRPSHKQARKRANLPSGWRHEALSVRMARAHPDISSARDAALVLWLIGSHHGCGRPFFDFCDPTPEDPLPYLGVSEWQLLDEMHGPQSLAFNFDGADWSTLYENLKRRYGIWNLAYLEAILRLSDHRASEKEQNL